MMDDQLTRQAQIEQRLEQSKRLLQGASDPTTTERISKFIADLEHEKVEETQK